MIGSPLQALVLGGCAEGSFIKARRLYEQLRIMHFSDKINYCAKITDPLSKDPSADLYGIWKPYIIHRGQVVIVNTYALCLSHDHAWVDPFYNRNDKNIYSAVRQYICKHMHDKQLSYSTD